VPTPRALELRDEVGRIVRDAETALSPQAALDLGRLTRSFTLRISDGFVESFGADILARVAAEAPGVRLRFVQKQDKSGDSLRDGSVDLDTGVVEGTAGPELRAQALFPDRFVGAVRAGHPLSRGEITASRYAAARHILVSRRGLDRGPVDDALAPLGLARDIVVTVGGFSAALALARAGDLVATVPDRHTAALRQGMLSFALPAAPPEITVSLLWHPRMDADPAHRWLRGVVREVCRAGN
jgi:DNA-binding transcriptional LysR family regulator